MRIIAVGNVFLIFPEDSLEDQDFEKKISSVLSSLLSNSKGKEESP